MIKFFICDLAICKYKKCIGCVVPINDHYLQQHQLFFQISRLLFWVLLQVVFNLIMLTSLSFFFFQSQLIPVCCISVFSPSFVCLAWQHGNCFICDVSSLPRNSLSSLKKVVANVLILWDTVSTGLHVFQEVSLFLHLNLWWTKAAIPNTCSY